MPRINKKLQAQNEQELMKEILAKQEELKYVRGAEEDDLEEEEYELGPSKEVVEKALSKAEMSEKKLAELEARLAEKEAKEMERVEKAKMDLEEKSKAKMTKKQEKELKQKEQEEILKRLQEDYANRSERLKNHQAMIGIKQTLVANACRF